MNEEFDNQVSQTQPSFNDFIATNSEALPIIKSMRERLIDYGDSVVKGLGVENWDDWGKHKQHLKWIRAGTDIVICRLTLPNRKSHFIAVELSFDKYLLHWGFCVYSYGWLVEEKENLKVLEKEKLKQYVEGRGFKNEIRENKDTSAVSIRTLIPTGKGKEDAKLIRDNFEQILRGLLKERGKVKKLSPQKLPAKNNYSWGQMFNEYKRKELYDKPDKTPTFLEVARINEKEIYISNLLAFFFDEGAPHPLGNIFFRALYQLGTKGKTPEEDTEIRSVSREHLTDKNKKIDILIQTNHHVVVIEAKIWARLYNDLEDYKNTADDLARSDEGEGEKDKRVIRVVLHIEDNQLTKKEEERAKSLGFKSITYKDLLRRATQLLVKSNYSQLYHKDVDSLYLQLFFDLVTTIENLSSREEDKRQFGTFLSSKGNGYWPRQAILNSAVFHQDIMCKIEKQIKEGFWYWFAEQGQAVGRAGRGETGKIYSEAREGYMFGRVLVYDTNKCAIPYIKGKKVGINTSIDWESQAWIISVFLRNGNIRQQKHLTEHLKKEKINSLNCNNIRGKRRMKAEGINLILKEKNAQKKQQSCSLTY